VLDVIWVVLPVLGAFVVHAPVLRWDVLPALKVPLDGGATFRGRRIFGDNKTWRGAFAMGGGVCGMTLLLSCSSAYWSRLPAEIRTAGPLTFGVLLGVGTVAGELPNSFLKRRLDIAPGTQRRSIGGVLLSFYDQADFVPGIWLLLLPIWTMSVAQAAVAFAVVTAVHLLLNVVGWVIGARDVPI
jgi:CDP-archaeol synthase